MPQGSVAYTYDAAGRRPSFQVADQNAVTYTYDNADRLTGIVQSSAQVDFTYDAASRRTTLTLPNGIAAIYSYDTANQLSAISYANGSVTVGTLLQTACKTGWDESLERMEGSLLGYEEWQIDPYFSALNVREKKRD